MSTNRTLPTTPISAIPAGTDVRDLRNHLNRIIGTVNTLLLILRAVSQATRIPVVPPHNPAIVVDYPFQLYKDAGKLCCSEGNHYWFNSYSNAVNTSTLSETGPNSWPLDAASTVYVQRTYNSDGSATVVLVRTADSIATVKAGQNATVMRFVIGTCSASGIITQRWLGGDIDEGRVA